jgi:hypothetical protein
MDSDEAKLLSQRIGNRHRVVIIMVDHPYQEQVFRKQVLNG